MSQGSKMSQGPREDKKFFYVSPKMSQGSSGGQNFFLCKSKNESWVQK
jgi:hypothetical protein